MFDLMPFERKDNSLFRYFDDFDRSFFGGLQNMWPSCQTDIVDQGDRYILRVDLPGFEKEEIHLDVEGGRLTLSAEHKEEKEEKDRFIRRERRYGSVSRSFDIANIDAENIKASYKNGVLELNMPKKAERQPQQKPIEIH